MSNDRIYLSPPHMGGTEFDFVREAFDTNWLSTVGPHLVAFENEMQERLGRPCVALASGTSAIHIGLRLMGVGPGDEVLCPSLTFVASCNPIVYLGAKPVFVDSERDSWNMDADSLRVAIEARIAVTGHAPKALVLVHLYGHTVNMKAVRAVCDEHGVAIFEDAAEGLGASYGDLPAGALAPLAALSFNGNKIITTTGGGMLVCELEEHAARARHWATQARDPGVAYEHSEVGYNYRLSNVLAGIGRGQLQVLDERVSARRRIFDRYAAGLPDAFEASPEADWGSHTRWLSTFLLSTQEQRDHCISMLSAEQIEARPVWKPMHLQPLFADAPMYGGEVAEDLFHRGMCLPSGSSLSAEQQSRVIESLKKAVL